MTLQSEDMGKLVAVGWMWREWGGAVRMTTHHPDSAAADRLYIRPAHREAQPETDGGGEVSEAARIIACHLPVEYCPDSVCLPITMTAGDLRLVYAALASKGV